MKYQFPENFLWGASTSSHQVEGGNRNDWSEWEKKNAARLAKEAGKKLAPWQQKQLPEMFKSENYISGRAGDHYNLYEKDFDLAKSLGHNAHRFSIEWSRIEPEEGKFDEREIEHYRQVLIALRERGMEPFVSLWHWTLPIWLRDKGGFRDKKFPEYFTRYAETMSRELSEVKFWITLNEPEIIVGKSYVKGEWPPQMKNPFAFLPIMNNVAKAHIATYDKIRRINPSAKIGIAKNNTWFESAGGPINWLLKKCADRWWNFHFLEKIRQHQDFIGLNHYFHNRINYGFNKNKNEKTSDMGWELYPEAIYHCLVDLKKYAKPIYITENGLADAKDKYREWFIKETLENIHRAISDGADVRGYLHWSLMDNFEWDKGFWPRFGLIEIDYQTLERKPRPSAYAYKKIIEQNGFD